MRPCLLPCHFHLLSFTHIQHITSLSLDFANWAIYSMYSCFLLKSLSSIDLQILLPCAFFLWILISVSSAHRDQQFLLGLPVGSDTSWKVPPCNKLGQTLSEPTVSHCLLASMCWVTLHNVPGGKTGRCSMAGEPGHQSLIRVANRHPEMGFKTLSVAL